MKDRQKGHNKRCSQQFYVSGAPTAANEKCWVLRDNVPTMVRSRHQFSELPERVIVAPVYVKVDASWFNPTSTDLPTTARFGYSSRSLARAGTSRRLQKVLQPNTKATTKSPSAPVTSRPRHVLGTDAPTTEATYAIAHSVQALGGRAVIVGGAVRDMLRGALLATSPSAIDVDIEVFGISPAQLRDLLSRSYRVDTTGAAFEVLKVHVPGTPHPLDVSMPRRERATGPSRRDFDVSADPTLSFAQAAARRDFTIGAMGYDPLSGELLDPYGGAADLAAKVLRHVSPAFEEDPLRVLRAARFAARFDLTVHPHTAQLARNLRSRADQISMERIFQELDSTLDQALTPGRGLHVLKDVNWIDLFAPLANLRGVAQDPTWHPEGDVFIHTAHVLDFWSKNLRTGNKDDDRVVAFAALCHDFGKATTTTFDPSTRRYRAHGHESAGVAPARELLCSYGQPRLAAAIVPLIENHLAPVQLGQELKPSARAVRRLATRVGRIDLLVALAKADQGGRPPKDPSSALEACDRLLDQARTLNVTTTAPQRLASGDHLIELGLSPSKSFKELLDAAYEAQLDGLITTEAEARSFLESRLNESR